MLDALLTTIQSTVMLLPSVQIVLGLILPILQPVQPSSSTMLILQNNLTSVNTSFELLQQSLKIDQPHVILLQEIWRPKVSLKFHGYNQRPIILERTHKGGGGVAIITRKDVRCLRKVELELPDLEAVWAEVSVKSKKFLVGSVYIRNNSVRDIRLFQQQMSTICQKYDHIVIGMDANAHHPLWDDLCVGNRSHTSLSMGEILVQTAEENDMHIHNSGVPTFYQSGRTTAPDVTLTKGMSMYGNISWSLSSKTLGSNHEPILLRIGDQNPSPPE